MIEQKPLERGEQPRDAGGRARPAGADPSPQSTRRGGPGEPGKVIALETGRRPTPPRGTPASGATFGAYPAPRGDDAEARVALLEFLLASDDAVACAQRAVEWLGERTGIERILCAVADPARGLLIGAAGWGLPPPAVSELTCDLTRRDDPLVRALAGGTPQMFRALPGADHPSTPFGRASFMTFPLSGRGPRGDARAGLLLTSPIDCNAARDVHWLAAVLAQKLVGLPRHADPVDSGLARTAAAELARRCEQLRRQELALERAAAVGSQFLAGVSHELRTPLTAVLGYTSMLLEGVAGDVTERQRAMLRRVDRNGKNLLSVINGVLDIAEIEGGRVPLVLTEVAIQDAIGAALEELGPVIARARPAVRVELPPGLPLLRTDVAKLKQILVNLITNALKFTEEGTVTLRAAFDPAADRVAIAVADTGIGIPESEQSRLFEDFQRIDSPAARRAGGAGLGLSISQRLASLLGGRIALASAPGRGSTFTLLLPTSAPASRSRRA
ncbi:MAG: HAMP domain-containing histidine kinase [Polyangiaceae bacterium]|nr:HAMP domain-containing histidine kinase [Polyangiaceae bacterium]